MFISKKKHNHIIEHKDKTINDYYAKIVKLEKELEQSKDLKELLKRYDNILFSIVSTNELSTITDSRQYGLQLPDNVLQYTENILNDKIIKQENIKYLIVDKKGNVKTELTKQKTDKNYEYKLVRE